MARILSFLFVCFFLVLTVQGQTKNSAIDLAWSGLAPQFGQVQLPSITFGSKTAVTFQLTTYFRGGGNGCALRFGSKASTLAQYVEVSINTGILEINVGGKSIKGPTVAANAFKQLSIVIENKPNGASGVQGYVTAYVDGTDVSGQFTNGLRWVGPVVSGPRDIGYLGKCESGLQFNGIVDDLRIWATALTATEIADTASMAMTDLQKANLVAHFPMNEGQGLYTGGVSGFDSDEFYSAVLSGNTAWSARGTLGMKTCGSSGDPHLTPWVGNRYDPPHIPGYFLMVQCMEGTDSVFEIRTYHSTGCCWGRATVTEAVTVKHFDTIFLVSRGMVYQKRDLPSTDFVTVPRQDQTLNSGMKLFFGYSGNYPYVKVYGPPYGYISVSDYTNYFIMTTGVTESCGGQKGMCSSQIYNLNNWQFRFDDISIPDVPLTDIPPRNNDPCANAIQSVKDAAIKTCDRLYPGTDPVMVSEREDCLFDVCASGDTTVVADRSSREVCYLQELRAAAGAGEPLPSAQCEPQCPNACSGLGQCDIGTGKCTCDAGWAGPDCRQRASLPYFTVQSAYYTESVLQARLLSGADFPSLSYDISHLIAASKFNVPSSVLFYIGQVAKNTLGTVTDNHLYIVNNANSDRSKGGYRLQATYDAGFGTGPTVKRFEASAAGITTPANPSDMTFSWQDGLTSGAIVQNLPADPWCITFSVQATDGLDQVLIGSGQTLLQSLDVFKLPKNDWTSFKICGKQLPNPCADIDNCKDCAAKIECGWCREKQACFLGNQAGPTDGTMCKNWRYSFESHISRRIEMSFSWPVNPDHSEVFLVEVPQNLPGEMATLPLDLTVDMGNEDTSVWDLQLIFPSAANNVNDKIALAATMQDILASLRRFPAMALGLGTYSNAYTAIDTVKDVDNDVSKFLVKVNGVTVNAAMADATPRAVLESLKAVALAQNPGWRSNSRRLVLIIVDSAYATTGTTVANVKASLLAAQIIPVFVATSAVKATYQDLVKQLGFGVVIDHVAGSQQMDREVAVAIRRAAGAVALVVDDNSPGHIDVQNYNTEIMNIQGLTQKMRGKFLFPMGPSAGTELVSKLIAPGFGKATVHNVLSDLPTATGQDVKMIEDQLLEGSATEIGVIAVLTGHAYDADAPVLARITVLPTAGKLYQFDSAADGGKGVEITATETLVLDPLFRVIYTPNAGGNSIGNAPYDAFTYVIQDACTDSLPLKINVHVTAVNHAPVATPITANGDEDTDIVVSLDGSDKENHPLGAIIVDTPYEFVNGEKAPQGELYQYNAGQRGAQIPWGQETTVTDANRRVIYRPKPDFNSEGKPAALFSLPQLTYKVIETSHPNPDDDPSWPMLESKPATLTIFINAVNDAPSVHLVNEAQLSSVCFAGPVCEFLEDFGLHFGEDITNPAILYVGGSDIEGDVLKVVFTAVQCQVQNPAVLVADGKSSLLATGDEITGLAAGVHHGSLRFKPALDTFGDQYCTYTYKVHDGQLFSDDQRDITIKVTAVNDYPRPQNLQTTIVAEEASTTTFNIQGVDPEGQQVSVFLTGCAGADHPEWRGKLYYNNQEIDCAALSTAPLAITGSPDGKYTFVWRTPDSYDIATPDPAQVLFFKFSDNAQTVGADSPVYVINFKITPINNQPLILTDAEFPTHQDVSSKTLRRTVLLNTPLTFSLSVQDDAPLNGYVYTKVDLQDANGLVPANVAEFSTQFPDGFFDLVRQDPNDPLQFNTPVYEFVAPYITVNSWLTKLTFKGAQVGTYTMKIFFSDMGLIGSADGCLSGEGCVLTADVTIIIDVVQSYSDNTSLAGAVAAGGLVASAAAAIVGWRKLRRQPEDGFQPWNLDEADDFVSANPLYEDSGMKGSNPLYDDKAGK